MPKLQQRMGGTKVCNPCAQFEIDCWPYVHMLLTKDVSQELRKAIFTIYPDFASLNNSAEAGCDICQMWRKALMNECYSQEAQYMLTNSALPLQLEPPTKVRSTTGLDIALLSPLRATVKITHQLIRNSEIKDAIIEDDIYSIELARRSGEVVKKVIGRPQNDFYLCATVETDPLSDVLWRRVTRWMDNCMSSHSSCRRDAPRQHRPARLVHIVDDSTIRVVDETEALENVDYIALSYCWGGEQLLKLDTEHEPQLRQGVPSRMFPPTIKDAFSVCRFLKTPYLWIDSLCIRQDGAGNDFEAESQRMDKIYGSAKLTLVISSAQGVMDGFLHPRASEGVKINPKMVRFIDGRLILQRKGLAEVRAKSPLAKRGWAVQEELLSKRLLYCTTHGIFWSCAEVEFAEHGNHLNLANEGFESDQSARILDPHSFINRVDPLFAWDQMIDQYSSRDLTLPQDRLPAVRGLASLIEQRTRTQYLFGMWRSRLPSQLLWVTTTHTTKSEQEYDEADLTSLRGTVPSWSWASTLPLQAIRMPGPELSHSSAIFLDVYELENTPCIRVQGRVRPLLPRFSESKTRLSDDDDQAQDSSDDSREQASWIVNDFKTEIHIEEAGKPLVTIQLDRRLIVELEKLVCFEINYQGFLLLEPGESDRYRRVGCSQLHGNANFFASSETTTIDLI